MDIRGWIEVNPRGIVGRVLLSSTFFALDLQVEAELRFSKPLAPPLNESLSPLHEGKGGFYGKGTSSRANIRSAIDHRTESALGKR